MTDETTNTSPARPERLRILGKTYRVEMESESRLRPTALGWHNVDKCLIVLQDELCHDQEAETLLHESLHALDMGLVTNLEERQVSALACGLLAFLRDNPAFVAYLLHEQPL